MDLERIPRWQWALLGLGIGVALAGTRSFYAPEYFGKSLDENFNVYAPGTARQPVAVLLAPGAWFMPRNWYYLSDLVVHVPTKQGNESFPIYWVTGVLHQVKPATDPKTGGYVKDGDGWKYEDLTTQDFFHRGKTPYRVGKETYPNILAYLDSLAGKDGPKRYRYAWWEMPKVVWTLYPLAAVIAIGGIWPTIVALLVGAGLGRKRQTPAPSAVPTTAPPMQTPSPIVPPVSEPILSDKEFGSQRDQFYPTEIHSDSPEK
jgi:hypothetical protein